MPTPQIRFPSRTRFKSNADFLERGVFRWMMRLVGFELYGRFRATGIIPDDIKEDAPELMEWLHEQAWPKVHQYVTDYQQVGGAKHMWTGEQYERNRERVVMFCLENFDPVRIHDRAVKGGQRSRRTPKFTPDMINTDDMRGLTVAQQATMLGCSVRTVKYLRSQLAETAKPLPPIVEHPDFVAQMEVLLRDER